MDSNPSARLLEKSKRLTHECLNNEGWLRVKDYSRAYSDLKYSLLRTVYSF
jgi:hypothetical protein